MWFFEPIARFYNWFLIAIGVEDMLWGSMYILGAAFLVVVALIFIVEKIKWLDSLTILFMSIGVFLLFGMFPMFVMQDSIRECKKVVVAELIDYDFIVYVNTCRTRTDMNGEFGEWKESKTLSIQREDSISQSLPQ